MPETPTAPPTEEAVPAFEPGLLDLDELVPDVPTIVLKGKSYEVMLPHMFSLDTAARLRRVIRQVQKATRDVDQYEDGNPRFATALAQLNEASDKMITVIVPSLPAEVLATLDQRKKARILSFFMEKSVDHLRSQKGTSAISLLGMLSGMESIQTDNSPTPSPSGGRSRKTSRD